MFSTTNTASPFLKIFSPLLSLKNISFSRKFLFKVCIWFRTERLLLNCSKMHFWILILACPSIWNDAHSWKVLLSSRRAVLFATFILISWKIFLLIVDSNFPLQLILNPFPHLFASNSRIRSPIKWITLFVENEFFFRRCYCAAEHFNNPRVWKSVFILWQNQNLLYFIFLKLIAIFW